MSRALDIDRIDAGYGPIDVLYELSLPVAKGRITAVLGPNGAGKTTTLKAIAGLVHVKHGAVRYGEDDIRGSSPRQIVAKGICLIPEGRGIFPSLSVRDNLVLQAKQSPGGLKLVESIAYTHFPVLGKRRGQIAGTLSGGEQQMLALSRALSSDPSVILIDEISMGLAPNLVERLFEVIRELANSGKTIVLVEQLAEFAMEIADYVAVISKGRTISVGEPNDVRDLLQDIYLGASGTSSVGSKVHVTDGSGRWATMRGHLSHLGQCPVVASRADVRRVTDRDGLSECDICAPTDAAA